MRLYHPVSLLALLLASPAFPQDTPSPAPSDSRHDPDIVVQGTRPIAPLKGGEWTLTLSRANHYGDDLTGTASAAARKDRTYRFCLHDTEVKTLIMVLVGQGQTTVSGTTSCGRMTMQLADAKLRGQQICQGGSVPVASASGVVQMTPTRATLTVTGDYTPVQVALRFESKLERISPPLVLEKFGTNTPPSRPDLTDWTITAVRDGNCPTGSTNNAP